MAFRDINLAQYINPSRPSVNVDITAPYRQWQAQRLNEAELAERQRQFDINEEFQRQQHADNIGHQRRIASDINTRFAITQGQQTAQNQYEVESNKFKQQQILMQKARAAAAESRWNEVESLLGTLKSLGANVDRTLDAEGRPSYRLQEGAAPSVPGETYESIQQKFGSSSQWIPGQRLKVNRIGENPFSAVPAVTEETRPLAQPNPSTDPQEAVQQPVDAQTAAQGPSAFDPYLLNSGELAQMNRLRSEPLLEGLKGAFPYQYQGNAESLFRGVNALGASPESTLEMLQKPLDTASRTWNAEMASEGQMARAGMSQSGSASSEARMRENEAYRRAEQRAKDVGLRQAIDDNLEFDEILKKINSGNPNAQADAVKHIITLREGNRITDQDFQIGKTGFASDWDQAKIRLRQTFITGLSEDQKSNFTAMLRMIQDSNKHRIKSGFQKLKSYSQSFRYEPERYGVYNYIRGAIPEEMWDDEMRSWDPLEYSGGAMPRQDSGQRKSVSATAPTPSQAVEAVDELSEFE